MEHQEVEFFESWSPDVKRTELTRKIDGELKVQTLLKCNKCGVEISVPYSVPSDWECSFCASVPTPYKTNDNKRNTQDDTTQTRSDK